MHLPRVSVVMAVYNGERYLREAVDSILGQTFDDFEFIVIDDASTDNTSPILSSYQDPRLRLLVNDRNRGLAQSLNRGLQEARGEFIARQDADDVSERRRLERQVEFLDAHADVALLGTAYTAIDGDGKPSQRVKMPTDGLDLRWELLFCCPFVHTSVMWRRALIADTVGSYDESLSYSLDFDLWHRITRTHLAANLPDHLVQYRLHDESMTSTFGERVREGTQWRIANAASLLGHVGTPDESAARFWAMRALREGWADDLDPSAAKRAKDDLLALQRAFSEEQRLSPEQAARHLSTCLAAISRSLVLIARSSAAADASQRRQLLRHAFRLRPAIFLDPKTAVRSGLALLRRDRRSKPEGGQASI